MSVAVPAPEWPRASRLGESMPCPFTDGRPSWLEGAAKEADSLCSGWLAECILEPCAVMTVGMLLDVDVEVCSSLGKDVALELALRSSGSSK